MASSKELAPLRKTVDALAEIRKQIQPFLRVIESSDGGDNDDVNSSSKHDAHSVAEARTAVALAVGTLRHMGARLGGRGGGGSGDKNDPLRLELERMRKMLVTLRKVDTRGAANDTKKKSVSSSRTDTRSGKSTGENTDKVAKKTDNASTEDIESTSKEDQKRKKRDSDESGEKKRRKMN